MPDRSQINLVKSLSRKEVRLACGLFVVEGVKLIDETIASGWEVERLYATERKAGVLPAQRITEIVSSRDMERMSHLKTPADALALVRLPRYALPANIGEKLTIALDGVQDPGNLGTIVRVADWFGIETIVCSPDTADCFNPKVVQATMGAILRVRLHYTALVPQLVDAQSRGVPIYGTFLEGEDIYGCTLCAGGIIVMGSEGRGVTQEVSALVSEKLFIPPYGAGSGGSESLNVAVATAIVCSEFRRRLRG